VPDICYYAGHRQKEYPYHLSLDWYYIIAAKLAFVLIYEVSLRGCSNDSIERFVLKLEMAIQTSLSLGYS